MAPTAFILCLVLLQILLARTFGERLWSDGVSGEIQGLVKVEEQGEVFRQLRAGGEEQDSGVTEVSVQSKIAAEKGVGNPGGEVNSTERGVGKADDSKDKDPASPEIGKGLNPKDGVPPVAAPPQSPPPPSLSPPVKVKEESPDPQATGKGDEGSKEKKSGGTQSTSPSPYTVCGKSKVLYRIAQSGEEGHDLSLMLKSESSAGVHVVLSAPAYLKLELSVIDVVKDTDVQVKIRLSDAASVEVKDVASLNISLGPPDSDFCQANVTAEMLDISSRKDLFHRFDALVGKTKIIGGSVVVLALVAAICSCICYRCRARKRHGAGAKYQEVQMSAPGVNLSAAFGHSDASADGWDEVWDDEEWEDTEAAISSSTSMVPSLSARGLNSRRTNKDSWEAWET